jgi:hypothetical protein
MSRVFGSDDKHTQRPLLSEPLPEQEPEQEKEPQPQPQPEPEPQISPPRSIYDMSRVFGSDDKHSQRPILREPLPEKEEEPEKEEPEPQQEPVQILSNIDEVAKNTSKDEKSNYIKNEFSIRGFSAPSNLGRNVLRKYVYMDDKNKKKTINLNDIYISMKNDTFDWNRYSENN